MSYLLEKTIKTPYINFDSSTGVFELSGKSIPENSIQFYQPVYEWLDKYVQSPLPKTDLKIQLDYFNTSSSKCIADVFKKLEMIIKNGKGEVNVTWMHDENDEDMEEAGEDYKSIIKIPSFNIVSFKKD